MVKAETTIIKMKQETLQRNWTKTSAILEQYHVIAIATNISFWNKRNFLEKCITHAIQSDFFNTTRNAY